LALGALLDGIPEQMVLRIGLARDDIISVALFAAIFVSNLPEGIGSAANLKAAGWRTRRVIGLWVGVAVLCTLATVVGHQLADRSGAPLQAVIDGFAGGALLVMLTNAMIPEAREKAGPAAGLAAVLGFAVAAGLASFAS
jgi:zinc transporter, ZIP family